MMKLVVINGTPRKFGRTRVVAKYIADQFEGGVIRFSSRRTTFI